MPASPRVSDRTWFGLARRTGNGVELEGALGPWSAGYDRAQVLLLDDHGPKEWLLLDPGEVNAEGVVAHFVDERPSGGSPPDSPAPPGKLCIAICTRDRAESLRKCLQRMQGTPLEQYEVLIVDNAPRSDAVKEVVDQMSSEGMRAHRIVEHRPGLAKARNAALRAIDAEYVAFTDDDARPDRDWATALHRGFAAGTNVAVVTGMAPPAELETRSQALFEKKLKWSTNLMPETFSMAKRGQYTWPFPYSAGHLGAGANFAVRRRIVLDIGGFDEALGAGTLTGSGEDNEMFVRVIRAGYELSYQPSAIVWHIHRREDAALRRVLFNYGKGLSAAAVREFLQPGRIDMMRGTFRGALNLLRERQTELDYGMPWSHLALEVAGVIVGPLAYAIERWRSPGRARMES